MQKSSKNKEIQKNTDSDGFMENYYTQIDDQFRLKDSSTAAAVNRISMSLAIVANAAACGCVTSQPNKDS